MEPDQINSLASLCQSKIEELDNILLKKGHSLTPAEKAIFAMAFETGVQTMADQVQPMLTSLELELAGQQGEM
jgi:hypothetical protein